MGSLKAILIAMGVGVLIGAGVYHFALCQRTTTPIAPVTIESERPTGFSVYTILVCGKERRFETEEELREWMANLEGWAKENCPPEIVMRTRTRTVERVVIETDTIYVDPTCPCRLPGQFRRDQEWHIAVDLHDERLVALDSLVLRTYVEQPDWLFHPAMAWGAITVEMPPFELRKKESRLPSWGTVGKLSVAIGVGLLVGSRL